MSSEGSSREGIVGFRLPGEEPVWWKGPVVRQTNAAGFVISSFDNDSDPWVLIPQEQANKKPEYWPLLPRLPFFEEDNQYTYQNKVQHALHIIQEGQLKKVVLSRSSTHRQDALPLPFFDGLAATYPDAFVYLLWSPQHGCWAGATPETLLAFRDGAWHTQALAGTLPNPTDREWADKEFYEQQLVTDAIVERIKNAGFHAVVGERQTILAGQVQHLSTPIMVEGKYSLATAMKLARELHPTPAVCGWPGDKARQTIADIEQRDRQLYTGYVGPVFEKEAAQLFVNLRCCQLWQEAVTLHMGGGIVAGSEPEAEWEETENKAQILQTVLLKIARS